MDFAAAECGRAIRALDEIKRLAALRTPAGPGVERREWVSVFDQIRLALQSAATVSRIFWPPRSKSRLSGPRARRLLSLTGIPADHGLSNRALRNHIEHIDERLDDWAGAARRPYMCVEQVLHPDRHPIARANTARVCAVIYDEGPNEISLFGHVFSLDALAHDLAEVRELIHRGLATIAAGWK